MGSRGRGAAASNGFLTASAAPQSTFEAGSQRGELTSDQEMERVLATRPRRKLTPEENLERRRLQFKYHQRRHRAKQQDLISDLELEVCQLAETVASMNDQRRMLLQSQNILHSRTTLVGAPVRVTKEYIRQFQHGYKSSRGLQQEDFLRSIMIPNVGGPDYEGIDQLMEQSRLYDSLFAKTLCTPNFVDVTLIGKMTSVVIDAVLTVYPLRDGVLCLYPNLLGSETIIQELISRPIDIPGKLRFLFDTSGACSWFGTDLDFVAGLQRVLGSLQKVALCMQDANMSFCTGQISPTCQAPASVVPHDVEEDLATVV